MSDTQNSYSFIKVLSKYLDETKAATISDEILDQRIKACTEELFKLLISKCTQQVKDKFPDQL